MMKALKRILAGVFALGLVVGPMAAGPASANCDGPSNCAELGRMVQRDLAQERAERERAEWERAEREREANRPAAPSSPVGEDIVEAFVLGALAWIAYEAFKPSPSAPPQPPQPSQTAQRLPNR
ncbi:hypothetical protein [Neomegalonema sp.]|uniref:hypothetical protein n=1 Tax=Neomegalonema sp. TaxID=2039713 RepID=UPI0026252A11|nr:hypothetical protein [Neomegalonema sp.]MDD2870013.1 hypothetical protein [Neomegalonema sp.]